MEESRTKKIFDIVFISLMCAFAITSFVCLFGTVSVERFGGHDTPIFNPITFSKVFIKNLINLSKGSNTPSFMAQCAIDGLLFALLIVTAVFVIINLIKGLMNMLDFFINKKEIKTKYFIRCVVYTFIVLQIGMCYNYYDGKSQGIHYGWAGIVSIIICSLTVFLYWYRRIFFESKDQDEQIIFLLKGISSGLLLVGAILGSTKQFVSGSDTQSSLFIVQNAIDYTMQGEIPDTTKGLIDFIMTIVSGILCFVGLLLTLLSFAKDVIPIKKNTMMTRLIVTLSITVVGSALCLIFYKKTYLGKGLIMMIVALLLCLAIEITLVILRQKEEQKNKNENIKENL